MCLVGVGMGIGLVFHMKHFKWDKAGLFRVKHSIFLQASKIVVRLVVHKSILT